MVPVAMETDLLSFIEGFLQDFRYNSISHSCSRGSFWIQIGLGRVDDDSVRYIEIMLTQFVAGRLEWYMPDITKSGGSRSSSFTSRS